MVLDNPHYRSNECLILSAHSSTKRGTTLAKEVEWYQNCNKTKKQVKVVVQTRALMAEVNPLLTASPGDVFMA
jgi:hypothetical protein